MIYESKVYFIQYKLYYSIWINFFQKFCEIKLIYKFQAFSFPLIPAEPFAKFFNFFFQNCFTRIFSLNISETSLNSRLLSLVILPSTVADTQSIMLTANANAGFVVLSVLSWILPPVVIRLLNSTQSILIRLWASLSVQQVKAIVRWILARVMLSSLTRK